MDTQNYFQVATSEEKLRGQYYTPPELVRLMLQAVHAAPGDVVFDPSCGDGEFLVGAVHHFADLGASPRRILGSIAGMDVNPEAAAAARQRLQAVFRERFGRQIRLDRFPIYATDALELPDRAALEAAFQEHGHRLAPRGRRRLLVLGNPPYVEAKRLPASVKKQLRRRYADMTSGAPDLYLFFLFAALNWLTPKDALGFVLPNRVLVNNNSLPVRERLLSQRRLLGIDFATRAALFPGAAVYPVVLYAGGKDCTPEHCRLSLIQRTDEGLVRTALPPVWEADYMLTEVRALFPTPADPTLAESLTQLVRQIPSGRLADVLAVRWSVSFHRRGLREEFVRPDPEGMRYPRRFLGGGTFAGNGEIQRYRYRWNGWWIDYDEPRLKAADNPVPHPALFEQPKIAICQNGRTLRAAYDADGFILKDTLLCGVPRETDHPLVRHPRALVGFLCSQTVHFFYSHVFHGSHVNGGYLHFLRCFLNDLPLGEWTDRLAEETAALVVQREHCEDPEAAGDWEARIEACVQESLRLTPEQRAGIRQWAESDEHWPLRDRTRDPAAKTSRKLPSRAPE